MDNLTAWERIPARPAQYAEHPGGLDRRLVDMLYRQGLSPLYTHQAQAVEAALEGKNVVLSTGTASGKSLAYHLVALQAIVHNPQATALYLFPTKALAQDQDVALAQLIEALEPDVPIAHNLYDGDTRQSRRSRIRRAGGILVSNPDMLHMGITIPSGRPSLAIFSWSCWMRCIPTEGFLAATWPMWCDACAAFVASMAVSRCSFVRVLP